LSSTHADMAVLEATAKKFESVNTELEGMLKSLLQELEVLQSAWKGAGGTSFTEVKTRWASDQNTLHQTLSQTAQAIRTSGRTYDATDTNAAHNVSAAQSGTQTLAL
jgi:WXG100 family type VII secretion target